MSMTPKDSLRLFVAASLPGDWISRFKQAQDHLSIHSDGISLTKLENMHVTLRFLGDVPQKRLHDLLDYWKAWKLPKTFPVGLKDYGIFERREGSLIYASLHASKELSALARDLRQFPQEFGIAVEKRRFLAHITLARRARLQQSFDVIKKDLPQDFPERNLEKIILYQSEFTPTGMRYHALKQWVLE